MAFTLFEKSGFTVCQNFLLTVTDFISRFAKLFFLAFSKMLTQRLLCFLYSSLEKCPITQKLIPKSRAFHNCYMKIFCRESPLVCSKLFLFHRGMFILNFYKDIKKMLIFHITQIMFLTSRYVIQL